MILMRPPWLADADPFPVPFHNPHYPVGEYQPITHREVAHLTSARVAELEATNFRATGLVAVPAHEVLRALLRLPNEHGVVYPPWPASQPDLRRTYLANLARHHKIKLKVDSIEEGNLLVRLMDRNDKPHPRSPLEVLTPMEAEKRVIAMERKLPDSFLRPGPRVLGDWESPDDRDEYEPYDVYIRRLQQVNAEDPGSAVVFPYLKTRDRKTQQIRLHQEAARYGLALTIFSPDRLHALLRVNRRNQAALEPLDGRRQIERFDEQEMDDKAEEARIKAELPDGGRGAVVIPGGGKRDSDSKAQPATSKASRKRSMENL